MSPSLAVSASDCVSVPVSGYFSLCFCMSPSLAVSVSDFISHSVSVCLRLWLFLPLTVFLLIHHAVCVCLHLCLYLCLCLALSPPVSDCLLCECSVGPYVDTSKDLSRNGLSDKRNLSIFLSLCPSASFVPPPPPPSPLFICVCLHAYKLPLHVLQLRPADTRKLKIPLFQKKYSGQRSFLLSGSRNLE